MTQVLTIEALAAICHDANASLCRAQGDHSQLPWLHAPDWQKESALKGVEFHLDNPDAGPDAGHRSWLAQKEQDGWVYGPVKDPEATPPTHPCMVPFDQLPPEQQAKDHLFRSIVHGLAPFVGHSRHEEEHVRPVIGGVALAKRFDFGLAVHAMKSGARVAREGWNGKGMFAYLVPAASYPVQTGAAKEYFGEGAMVPYRAYLALKTVDEDVATWTPSVSDVLATDWTVVT